MGVNCSRGRMPSRLLDRVGQDQPKLIEDVVPKQLSLAMVQKILQNLLRERTRSRTQGAFWKQWAKAQP